MEKENFSLKNIQKLTKNSQEIRHIITKQQRMERIKWIERKIEERARKGEDSYTYVCEDPDSSLVESIENCFVQKGFLVNINVLCGLTYIAIDWNEDNISKKQTEKKLFRHFF